MRTDIAIIAIVCLLAGATLFQNCSGGEKLAMDHTLSSTGVISADGTTHEISVDMTGKTSGTIPLANLGSPVDSIGFTWSAADMTATSTAIPDTVSTKSLQSFCATLGSVTPDSPANPRTIDLGNAYFLFTAAAEIFVWIDGSTFDSGGTNLQSLSFQVITRNLGISQTAFENWACVNANTAIGTTSP